MIMFSLAIADIFSITFLQLGKVIFKNIADSINVDVLSSKCLAYIFLCYYDITII